MDRVDLRDPGGDVEVMPVGDENLVRADEFRCIRCGVIVPRTQIGDTRLPLCPECTKQVATTLALV
jgi:hypothetical protein